MAHSEYRPRSKRRKSWLGRILIWTAGIVVAALVAVVIATPWILRAGVPEGFARFGMQASVTGGSLSLLRREITLEGFVLGAPDAPALSLGELGVGLGLRALIEGRIKLRHLRVKNVSLSADRLLALKKLGDTQSASAKQSLPVELDELELEDVRLVSLSERLGHDVRVSRLSISNVSALLADKKSKLNLQGTIGEGSVNLQLEVGMEKQDVSATGKFQIDKVPVRGWARLVAEMSDPISAGVVNGRGDISAGYGLASKSLHLSLDGRVSLAELGVELQPVNAEHGDASWQGRLALQWSPDLATPKLRGDGSLDVATLHLALAASSQSPLRAAISDISWHGDFDWQDSFMADGTFLGSSLEVRDASGIKPAWQTHAEDFSWRLHAKVEGGSGEFGARIQDFTLSRFSVTVADGGSPVHVAAEKLAVDEMRAAQSGDLVLGLATVDTLTITGASGANSADEVKYRLGGLAAKGLSGDFSGKLQAAQVSAESMDYSQSGRRVRADEIDFASVGFSLPARVSAGELKIKSARADMGQGDIWMSGLTATGVHGDSGGRFGAEAVDATHIFQNGSSKWSWDAAELKIRGLHGDTGDAAHLSAIDLDALKIGIGETSWESSGLHTADVAVSMTGEVKVENLGLAKLERHQPSAGDLRITGLDARAFRLRDERAVLGGVKAATLEFKLNGGEAFEARALEARGLGADLKNGLEASHFSVGGGAGNFVGGARLSAAALEIQGLSVAPNSDAALRQAELQRFTYTGPDAATLDLERLSIDLARWEAGGRLSAVKAALHAARFAHAEGVSWELEKLDTSKLDWQRGVRISADAATLASASQMHGQSQDWRARALLATGFNLALPGDVQVSTLAAQSVDGSAGSLAWKVISIDVKGLGSSEDHGHKVDKLESGEVTLTDARNSAMLSLERAEIGAARLSTRKELSAEQLLVESVRIRSEKPDWPARLAVAELQIAKPLLRADGGLDLGSVVARNPYLIVAQAEDNSWMWPPLPGAGHKGGRQGGNKGDEQGAGRTGSSGGIRVSSFITRGLARIAYIDRATKPAIHLVLDPVVIAVENLDTHLPGNVSHFRARGSGFKFGGVTLDGELRTRVGGMDLGLKLDLKGVDLPELNPYVARREALAVTAGRGDAHNDIKIENKVLSGKVDVLLSGLQAKTTLGGETFTRIDPLNFPIRTAVALLKDRQGNIFLIVPMRERTDEPSFDFVDEFQKDFLRTLSAAGKVAANLPGKTLDRALELLEGTVSLLPGVSAKRYAPVEFTLGADGFSAEPLVYLDQIGARMREREALALALCGRSVPEDQMTVSGPSSSIDTLFAEASKGVYGKYEPGRDGLLALAEARADLVRRYLRNVYQISEGRLSSCDALIDDGAGATPRVELQVKTPAGRSGLFDLFL